MLQSLHVKNLALIEEIELEFGRGLNILTGETGAGKSLLLGSVNLALGGKFEKEMLRKGADSALVELIFSCEEEKVIQKLQEMDLEQPEDGCIIVSRKMQVGKNVCRINGETVTTRQLKELAEVLIDIHGQHEHQSLLHKKNHMNILDSYCKESLEEPAVAVSKAYKEFKELEKKLNEEAMDEQAKEREQALAQFECQEIAEAKLQPGEDEELEKRYRRMVNGKRIVEGLAESYRYTGSDTQEGAGNSLSRALRALRGVTAYDDNLAGLEQQLSEIENLLADYNRDVSVYMDECEFDVEDFNTVEDRLNTINHLKGKYGNSIEEILQYGEERQAFLHKLLDYDAYVEKLQKDISEAQAKLKDACEILSRVRRQNAAVLSDKLKEALIQLNFLTVDFEIAVIPDKQITQKGYDEVEFLISTNPGEDKKSLSQVASGGELSRIMLAIKTVLAGEDDIDTLIFDEIDAGISGKTAWKVSEKLATVAAGHQVICITHLPQIAAMADMHFVIEKNSSDHNTITDIRHIEREESLKELARLLGSDTLTEAALTNAREMRNQAYLYKEQI